MHGLNWEEPKEDEINLPKDCYLKDGKSKIDFVIVVPEVLDHDRAHNDTRTTTTEIFLQGLKDKGLIMEEQKGKYFTTLKFIKIHAPHKILMRYARIFKLDLTCHNPYYKYKEKNPRFFSTILTNPNPYTEVYTRAKPTLSGEKPTGITSAERSLIVVKIINQIKFHMDFEVNLASMLKMEIFLDAYPIHDGCCEWTKTGPLTDRQLLCHYWANMKYIMKEQPVHLLEKYYGPKIAFFFAFKSYYTKMLMIPTVIGVLSGSAGLIYLDSEGSYINEEVCASNIVLCHVQHMKSSCSLMKLAYFIDNPITVFYVMVCCFWGAIFWNVWQRRQAMLRLRWNLFNVKIDRTMRMEFKQKARTRRSSISGEVEFYVPASRKVLGWIISYTAVFILVIIFIIIVNLVVFYRFWLMNTMQYDSTRHANIVESVTSSLITTGIVIGLNEVIPHIVMVYSKLFENLTKIQIPRTQLQYNRMLIHKLFIIIFMNNLIPFFYLAFFKGFFFTHPGSMSELSFVKNIQWDLCKPSGCLVDLGIHLIIFLLVDNVIRELYFVFKTSFNPLRVYQYYTVSDEVKKSMEQWEKDYTLNELDESIINQLYMELALQYSYITFFNSASPIVGLVAVIHNLIKTQLDAFRFIKWHRRPTMEKVPDIEGWNEIFKVITFFGAVSNSFVIAFRNDFILRLLYRHKHDGSLKGFINSTLSKFAVKDLKKEFFQSLKNETYCYYRGYRYPPEHELKYQPTSEYWEIFSVRAVVFIVLENFILIMSLMFGFVIPAIPRKVKVKLEDDAKLLREAKEALLEEKMKRER